MDQTTPRTVIITGASTGIGAAVALAFAVKGYRLSLGARRADRLAEVALSARELGAEVYAGPLDITDANSIDRFFAASEAALGIADVIVNNAGCSRPALLHEYEVDWLLTETATNFTGPILTTRRALQPLVARRRSADILFVSSDAVHSPRPHQTLYGAAKAGIENFANGLARELEGSGIRVTKVRLGPTVSEFGADWDFTNFAELVEHWRRFGLRDARLIGELMPTEAVAQAIVEVVEKPSGVWVDTIELQPAGVKQG